MWPRSAFEGKPGGSGDDAAQAPRRCPQVDLPQVRACRSRAGRVCCLDLFRAGYTQVGRSRSRSRCRCRAGRVYLDLLAAGCHPQAELPHLAGCRCRCRRRCRAWRASCRDLFPARCPQVGVCRRLAGCVCRRDLFAVGPLPRAGLPQVGGCRCRAVRVCRRGLFAVGCLGRKSSRCCLHPRRRRDTCRDLPGGLPLLAHPAAMRRGDPGHRRGHHVRGSPVCREVRRAPAVHLRKFRAE